MDLTARSDSPNHPDRQAGADEREPWRREYDQMMRERQAIQDRLQDALVERILSEIYGTLDCPYVPIMIGREAVAAIVWELEKDYWSLFPVERAPENLD